MSKASEALDISANRWICVIKVLLENSVHEGIYNCLMSWTWIDMETCPPVILQNCLSGVGDRNCICLGSRSEIIGTFGWARSARSTHTVRSAWESPSWCSVDEKSKHQPLKISFYLLTVIKLCHVLIVSLNANDKFSCRFSAYSDSLYVH